MTLSTFNTLLSLVFAPSFILLMQYFDFTELTFVYAVVMFCYLLVSIYLKSDLKTISTPLIYFVFIVIAYFFVSMESIKIIPALISSFFFLFFLESYINKRESILKIAKKFYPKEFSSQEERFIAKSDGFWTLVTFINVVIQLYFAFKGSDVVWAFYSSVGWYIYFLVALIGQVVYGKWYNNIKNEGL